MTTRTRGAAAGRAALAGALALALGGPLLPAGLGAGAARADTLQAGEACPANPLPHQARQLTVSYNNQDPANDTVEATLTLCGKADLRKAAYEISLDAAPPLFSDADRNGDGTVDRHDFCAQTRGAVSGLDAGRPVGVGTATLVPGAGAAPDQIRFVVPVDAIAPGLARDGSVTVYAWAETRQNANAAAPPTAYVTNRTVVDRLPVPNPTDGCALPQAAGEVLAVTLAAPDTPKTVFVSSQTYGANLGGLAAGRTRSARRWRTRRA